MKKRGFTLVELLAVITILAVIALITIPIVTKTISNSRKSTSDRQKEQIEKAAQSWFIKEYGSLSSSDTLILSLDRIKQDGYIEQSEVIDIDSGDKMGGCVKVTYSSNQYHYSYEETNCSCSDDSCHLCDTNNSSSCKAFND